MPAVDGKLVQQFDPEPVRYPNARSRRGFHYYRTLHFPLVPAVGCCSRVSDVKAAPLAPVEWKMFDEKDPWTLGVNPYDFVVYDPKMPLKYEECKPTDFGDRYNCHFQVIYDANRKAYFAFWTQATKETATDMHIAFSKSTDLKAGWTQPVVLGGNERRSESRPMAYWQQPMLSAKGRLYCL